MLITSSLSFRRMPITPWPLRPTILTSPSENLLAIPNFEASITWLSPSEIATPINSSFSLRVIALNPWSLAQALSILEEYSSNLVFLMIPFLVENKK